MAPPIYAREVRVHNRLAVQLLKPWGGAVAFAVQRRLVHLISSYSRQCSAENLPCCNLCSYGNTTAMGCKYFTLMDFQTYWLYLATSEHAISGWLGNSYLSLQKDLILLLTPKCYWFILVWFGGRHENPSWDLCLKGNDQWEKYN